MHVLMLLSKHAESLRNEAAGMHAEKQKFFTEDEEKGTAAGLEKAPGAEQV